MTHDKAGVSVEGLEWDKHPSADLWTAQSLVGIYDVSGIVQPTLWQFKPWNGDPWLEDNADSVEAAKSAAQADYAARIRSALSTTLQEQVGCPDGETHQAERACSCQIKEEGLERFGYHPEPATDFCIEVGALEGLYFDATHGISKPGTDPITIDEVRERVEKAMQFTVGGDEDAVRAKGTLREIASKIATLAHQPVTAGWIFSANEGELLFEVPGKIVVSIEADGIGYTILRGDAFEAGKFEQFQIDDVGRELSEALAALKSEGGNPLTGEY